MVHDRIIKLDGPLNFRDVGGYQNENGQKVKWNKIYRSDSLSSLTATDQTKLVQLRIAVDCDLRSQYEKKSSPDIHWSNVKYVDVPIYDENESGSQSNHHIYRFLHHIPNLNNNFIGRIYQQTLLNSHSREMFAQIFTELLKLKPDQALVYHCSAGKDRTGMVSALILMALGVGDDTIARDYLLTNKLYDFAVSRQLPSNDEITQMVAKMNVTKGEGIAIRGITETIRGGWGDFATFFEKELGFNSADLTQLRQMYLE
ncbi:MULTISPECIES: tyrosine-protein phosphatase [unclassified Lactobacillus]|uniref:tyrosine-protein phosphatase n=1 Tax=unclassified Lactobacillus TaxID=2620435 RepID=UPI000EFB50E9|nr:MULTISPECIES: tyrosine-protein phosphatase [unclassified Lactobacillus]RMC23470.1 tyrosine-protein phosphatase [Lactobacillus sp. ESL0247]RMC27267.1 tyrosine-protein phosphatase [Lactobacillus sp. ESL0246]RMC30333.1 tyrosine-protein phosphatase [Lactobacillus sp. ESL0245]